MSQVHPKSTGQQIAEHSVAMRRKFGKYPVGPKDKPLDGHRDDEVPGLPNFEELSDSAKLMTPVNREDYRRRIRPHLGKIMKRLNYSYELHQRVNDSWRLYGDEG